MDIVALGELLVDFTYVGRSKNGMRLFEQNPGGAPANVACCAAALGAKAAFIGKVGKDMHGDFLKSVLEARGVSTEGLVQGDEFFTTLAFVQLHEGERSFSFARKPGADTMLREDELSEKLLKNTRVLSIGSLSLTGEPARTATLKAIKTAKAHGTAIAYDPNYRAPLWESAESAAIQMRSILPLADMIKISDEEAELLTGVSDPVSAIENLQTAGVTIAVVTLGSEGALVRVSGKTEKVAGYPCKAVDTTGAGDAFWGGFLSAYMADAKSPSEVTIADAAGYARMANAVAACCVQKYGAIPAMPDARAVSEFLKTQAE